jgi:hypothetical protein
MLAPDAVLARYCNPALATCVPDPAPPANDVVPEPPPVSGVRPIPPEGAEAVEGAEVAEGAELAEAAEAVELAEAADAAALAEEALVTGALLEEIPVAGWIIGTALIVGAGGYLVYRHYSKGSRKPAPAPPKKPAPTPAPAKKPVMPPYVGEQMDKWKKCQQLHDDYKQTQEKAGSYAKQMDELEKKLQDNKASDQDRIDFCRLLEERLKLVQDLHKQRLEYITSGCDEFPWFEGTTTTEAERREAHQKELDHVDKQIDNLFKLLDKFCKKKK